MMAGPLLMLFIMASVHAAMMPTVIRVDMSVSWLLIPLLCSTKGTESHERPKIMFMGKQARLVRLDDKLTYVRTRTNTSKESAGCGRKNTHVNDRMINSFASTSAYCASLLLGGADEGLGHSRKRLDYASFPRRRPSANQWIGSVIGQELVQHVEVMKTKLRVQEESH